MYVMQGYHFFIIIFLIIMIYGSPIWPSAQWLTRASSHIISGGLVLRRSLNGVGQEAEDGSDPQQDGEASKELSAEFDPFWGGGRWGESVGTITSEILRSFSVSQTLDEEQRWEKLIQVY